MQGLGNFAAGFLGAFTAAKQQKKQREQDEQEKKARVKLYELQLEREKAAMQREQQQTDAMGQVFERLQGGSRLKSNPNVTLESPLPKMSLSDMLVDSQMQGALLQSGLMGAGDMLKANAGPDPTTNQRDYNFYVQQEMQAGRRPLSFNDWDLQARAAGAPKTSINTGDTQYGKIPEGMRLVVTPTGPRLERIEGPPGMVQTAGAKAVDSAFAPEYATWISGGYADTQKGLSQLREAKKALESGENLTGPILGSLPDKPRMLFNEASVNTRQQVEEVVQRNLRAVLGGQFAQAEAMALISRAYNEQASEKENAKRVGRLIKQIDQAAKAKQEAALYFQRNGTLDGFPGKLWTMADFDVSDRPSGIPDDARFIGTASGKPVYETPDGKKWIED